MNNELLDTIVKVVLSLAVGYSTYISKRSAAGNQKVRDEIIGPADEPSLREALKLQHAAVLSKLTDFESGLINFNVRMKSLENTVFDNLESRLKIVERDSHDTKSLVIAVSSMHELCSGLSQEMARARLNIHNVANASHIRLLTQEEAAAVNPPSVSSLMASFELGKVEGGKDKK